MKIFLTLILSVLTLTAHAKTSLEMNVTYGDRKTSFELENETLKFTANDQGENQTHTVKLSKKQIDELKKKLAALEKTKSSTDTCSRAFVKIKAEKFEKKECLSNAKSEIVEFTNWVSRQVE